MRTEIEIKAMTPEQKRIAIAEAMPSSGWVFHSGEDYVSITHGGKCVMRFYPSEPEDIRRRLDLAGVPDFLSDLNAMHEAEKALPKHTRSTYTAQLRKIVVSEMDSAPFQDPDTGTLLDIYFYGASAAQRADAFLTVISK